ncbi:MAG: hypothetical protein Q7T23_19225, partial [Phenylobacterium sp.]|nr:hypothetical protein [Phenylobacterium sp.]
GREGQLLSFAHATIWEAAPSQGRLFFFRATNIGPEIHPCRTSPTQQADGWMGSGLSLAFAAP